MFVFTIIIINELFHVSKNGKLLLDWTTWANDFPSNSQLMGEEKLNRFRCLANAEAVLATNLFGVLLIIAAVVSVISFLIVVEVEFQKTSTVLELTDLKGTILLYDEILTMSGSSFSLLTLQQELRLRGMTPTL
jgi:hypothetical protein